MSEGNGTRVTAESLDGSVESESRVIKDDYNLVTDGSLAPVTEIQFSEIAPVVRRVIEEAASG